MGIDSNDEELMLEYQRGNEEALEMLFLRYKKKIFNFAYRILANRADAEDVTSDIFLTLFSQKDRYQPEAKFSTWLYTMARNASLTKIRNKKNLFSLSFLGLGQEGKEESWDPPDSKPGPVQTLSRNEMGTHVRRAIHRLPRAQKEALILRAYEEMSYEEIRKILNCSLENVKVLIFRARKRLRKELAWVIQEECA